MVKSKVIDKITANLENSNYKIFEEIVPDPPIETVVAGIETLKNVNPDVIIALGGGSAIDAAKAIMDFSKKILKTSEVEFIAIPTTSGTGSEVTSFSVITDNQKGCKYPLVSYDLLPDVAILDPELVKTVPNFITADTGMDVLTHAIEAYVSTNSNDFSDALAEKAIKLVFKYLVKAYKNGNDKEAREKMHNASCMAGMAFTNAFLGINHSLAHKLGGEFHIPHGRANAILLPHVIKYNATKPSKFAAFPKYKEFVADKKFVEIAKFLGLKANTVEEGVQSLIDAVNNLLVELNIPKTIKECGVTEEAFLAKVDKLSLDAFDDQCTPANPRLPLVEELKEIYLTAFGEITEK